MPLIAVDIGNTHARAGLFLMADEAMPAETTRAAVIEAEWTCGAGGATVDSAGIPRLVHAWQLDEDEHGWESLPESSLTWHVASVHRGAAESWSRRVAARRPQDAWRQLGPHEFPIELRVRRPERVGADRVAAAVAASRLRAAGRPAVVVDAGSAVTVDAIDESGRFLGGAILPGIAMAAWALSARTDLLPQVAPPLEPPVAIGPSTEEAIRSGLYWGGLGAIRELVARQSLECVGAPELFLTGGGMRWADELPGARVEPHLVLLGVALAATHSP